MPDFSYLYIPADGSVADLKQRFRVGDGGPQIRNSDGSTVLADPPAGWPLLIPTPAESQQYADADWQNVQAQAGETLAALVSRTQADGPWKKRVYHADSPDTLKYIWLDYRNWQQRLAVLRHTGNNTSTFPETDIDPATAQFAGGETVTVPLTPATYHEAPVAPGTPGGTAPQATVDVSPSDLDKLREKLELIENALSGLWNTRRLALDLQGQLQCWLSGLTTIQSLAMDKATATKAACPGDTEGNARRDSFIDAVDTLLSKAAPALMNAGVATLRPQYVDDFQKQLAFLHERISDSEMIPLLAKVVPPRGDTPLTMPNSDAAIILVTHVSKLAAEAATWIADCAPRPDAIALLEPAIQAMAAAKPPSASAKSIIDFAVAVPFYDTPFETTTPAALAGAVAQAYLAVLGTEAAATKAGSTASTAIDRVADGLDKVASRWGWDTFKSDFQKVQHDDFGSFKIFMSAYAGKAKVDSAAGQAGAVDKLDAQKAAAGAMAKEGDEFWTAVLDAHNAYGSDKMQAAFEAVAGIQDPSTRFQALRSATIWDYLKVAQKIGKDLSSVADAASSATQAAVTGGYSVLKTSKDVLVAADKYNIFVSMEVKEYAVLLGRVVFILSIGVEVCEVVVAATEKDWWGFLGHGLVAVGSVLILVPGANLVGVLFVAAGYATLVVRDAVKGTDIQVAFETLFPKEARPDCFEATCRDPFSLGAEIDAVKQAFANATFAGDMIVCPNPDPNAGHSS